MAADPVSSGISAGGSLIGSIAGQIFSAGDRYAAAEAMRRAADAYNIPLPVLQQMLAEVVGPSAMESVQADPNLAGAQTEALGELKGISDAGGMTLEDRTNNELLQRDAAQRAQAQRQSIVNTLARQGVAPGGVSAALQLGAARDQQEAGALAGAKTAADARRRATEAVLQRGQMAGQVRQQGFNEASQRARAADQIAQYNAQAKERAQRYNLGIPQQQYQNQMERARGVAGAATGQANYNTGEANRVSSMWSDYGTGLGQAGAGVYQALQPKKKDEEDGT